MFKIQPFRFVLSGLRASVHSLTMNFKQPIDAMCFWVACSLLAVGYSVAFMTLLEADDSTAAATSVTNGLLQRSEDSNVVAVQTDHGRSETVANWSERFIETTLESVSSQMAGANLRNRRH